jgi:hypothetical protein
MHIHHQAKIDSQLLISLLLTALRSSITPFRWFGANFFFDYDHSWSENGPPVIHCILYEIDRNSIWDHVHGRHSTYVAKWHFTLRPGNGGCIRSKPSFREIATSMLRINYNMHAIAQTAIMGVSEVGRVVDTYFSPEFQNRALARDLPSISSSSSSQSNAPQQRPSVDPWAINAVHVPKPPVPRSPVRDPWAFTERGSQTEIYVGGWQLLIDTIGGSPMVIQKAPISANLPSHVGIE